MAAIPQVFKTTPKTYVPAETIVGGQLVEARASSRVGVAAAGSLKVIGVAVTDGATPESFTGTTTTTGTTGLPTLDATQVPGYVTVASGGIQVPVKFAAAAAFGDKLIAAANGTVTPAGATPDARTIVGKCVEPAGVAANATGLVETI